MRMTTMTFQFAHNYGALLQAYALKRYLCSRGHAVDVTPYLPAWAQKEYAYSPLAKGLSLKKRLKYLAQYPVRSRQARLFESFQKEQLGLGEPISSAEELSRFLSGYDAVIYGSDQIWNNTITGDAPDYFGGAGEGRKIAYAASLGTKNLTPVQEQHIRTCLPGFSAIAVREQQSKELIETILHRAVDVVCDPIFLLTKDQWETLEREVRTDEPFMLFYFLHKDPVLLAHGLRYAREHGCTPYVIHPTLASFPAGCTPLRNVGPAEFLWLIHHAQCVCTNSFHAVSFSVLYRKELLHIPNAKSPDRTISLLRTMGIEQKGAEQYPLYDLGSADYEPLDRFVKESKQFLMSALDGE